MSLTNLDPIALSIFGVAGVVVALAEVLLSRVRRVRMALLSLVFAVALAALAGVAFAAGESAWVGLPLLALAGVELLLAGIRLPLVGKLAGLPALQSGVVAMACVAVIGWQLHGLDAGLEADLARTDAILELMREPEGLSGPPALAVPTDAGRSIPLFTVSSEIPLSDEREAEALGDSKLTYKAIRTSSADPTTNCHGWVFTGGRHWLRSQFVEAVLEDNRYSQTSAPVAGDVAVFRNKKGEVTHTGIVRGHADGVVILESKWGKVGRYIHTAAAHPYGTDEVKYYRSPRNGHLLSGL